MTGNQVRENIIAKANLYWENIFEFYTDGEEFINFLNGTGDKKQWGGARRMAIFAKMENISIEAHSHGNAMHIFSYDN
eukprot:55959-Heterocapsa_arctica.AAC.1